MFDIKYGKLLPRVFISSKCMSVIDLSSGC